MSGRRLWVGVVVLACAIPYFVVRGPLRAIETSVDLPGYYTAARAWLLGYNPYDGRFLRELLEESGGPSSASGLWSLSPPATFPALAPLAVLRYPQAKTAVVLLNVLLVCLILAGLLYVVRIRAVELRGLLFLAAGLSLATIHTAISQGQLTILVTALLVVAGILELKKRDGSIGMLLGLGAVLKPQMLVAFLGYYVVSRRWHVVLTALAVGATFSVLGIARLEVADVPWMERFQRTVQGTADGGPIDPSTDGNQRFLMMNLQVALHTFLESRVLVESMVILFVLGVLVSLVLWRNPEQSRQEMLLTYSILAALTPLAMYSRFYTGTVLVFPLVWSIANWDSKHRAISVLCLGCVSVFFFPGTAALLSWQDSLPSKVVESWVWGGVLLSHQIYALLLLLAFLLLACWRDRKTSKSETPL